MISKTLIIYEYQILYKILSEINEYFDIIINDVNLTKSNKYLNTYKKTLFNADLVSEQELLLMINPVLKEENEWKYILRKEVIVQLAEQWSPKP